MSQLSPSSPRLPSGALSTMPFLIINLGAEMLYILQQRLRAQSIEESRTRKILGVVLASLLQPSFIEELFRPREAYSVRATRLVFEKIAHTSVMRLNKQSMDKLFDLMAMGVKLQLLASPDPPSLLKITQTHLSGMRDIATGDDGLVALLADATRRCMEIYSRMSLGELYNLKQNLLRFFQDRDVKVSLFLEENTQRADGVIVLPLAGPVPRGHEVPGTVRYFDGATGKIVAGVGASSSGSSGGGGVGGVGATTVPVSQKVSGDFPTIFLPALPISEGPVDASSTPSKLGANLYLKERKRDLMTKEKEKEKDGSSKKNNNNDEDQGKQEDDDEEEGRDRISTSSIINSPSSTSSVRRKREEVSESKLSPLSSEAQTQSSMSDMRGGSESSSVAGVNLLASLLGNNSSSSSSSSDVEIVDLFGDDEGSGGILASAINERGIPGGGGGSSLQMFGAINSTKGTGRPQQNGQHQSQRNPNTLSSMMASLGFNDDEEDSKTSSESDNKPRGGGGGKGTSSSSSRGDDKGGVESKEEGGGDNDDLLDLMDSL